MTQPPPGRNRLARESSPYLRQHADNPVDWYPWGDEAFARARDEQKPVLLSVGYSTCHWCHVMAHESFEDEGIAALMNESFVSIKVDREERPDIDAVYMAFTQAVTGQGGWPMTVFLTPDARPFFAGTYFPPDDAFGRPGFRRVLTGIASAWRENPDRLRGSASDLTARLGDALARQVAEDGPSRVTAETVDAAVERLRGSFDAEWGGFGREPKFPGPGTLEFLLAHDARAGEDARHPTAREMALTTLRRMAAGGIYDQLGGGFARYSVDRTWLVPHFEKMLYDNAQLARVYLHAHQVDGDPLLERIARETLDYLAREMLDPDGGFASAQDADSEGVEGKFFTWTPGETAAVLGDDAALFDAVFGVTPDGNFEDPHHPELGRRSVLSRGRPLADVAAERGMPLPELETTVADLRERMRVARDSRVHPARDDKVLASWNGLALAAFAEAGRVLGDERYRALAERTAAFLDARLWHDGRLLHANTHGEAHVDGMLEDYTYVGLGLVELFRATGDLAHLHRARDLFDAGLARCHDDDGGGCFGAPSDGEALILRQKPLFDAATPSGNGAMALLAFQLGRTLGEPARERLVAEVAALAGEALREAPSGFGSVLLAIELALAPRREIAVVGPPGARAPFERVLGRRYLPAAAIVPSTDGAGLPLLEGRAPGAGDDGAVAYVCADMVCDLPAHSPDALAAQLDASLGT